MNRSDFQKLAILRLKEARLLLRHRQYDGAYYLAGYVVECGLKACVAKRTKRFDFPPEPNVVRDCYTHSFRELIKVADLTGQRDGDNQANPSLRANWAIVGEWRETRRYQRSSRKEATELIEAIGDEPDGVLPWIKRYW